MHTQNKLLGKIIMTVIILCITLPRVDEILKPVQQYIPIGFILLILLEIRSRLEYRNGKHPNTIRIATNNDDYYKIVPFILGSILLIGGMIGLLYSDTNTVLYGLIIVTGILLFVSGFLFIPTGVVELSKDKLQIINGSRRSDITIDSISAIEFESSNLIITDNNNSKTKIQHLNLIPSDYNLIMEFLRKRLPEHIKIRII